MDPNLFYVRVWDLAVFKRLWLGEFKNVFYIILMTHCHGNNPRWPPNIYLKSLKLQSHCMQINFLFTVQTNIMLSSLLPRILWLLYFSLISLYYLHFMLVKMIPVIFQISITLKQISPSTDRLVKVKISTCTNSMQTFKTLPLLKAEP